MAVTKILARKGRLSAGIQYILNGDKTQGQTLTVHLNCDPGREARQMRDTKEAVGKTGGVQYYHMILSFKPGEITPELALQIAKEFAEEHLAGYETVISVHTDKKHIHAHLIFNSVNADTGEKYRSNAKTYYSQIRAVCDRLCKKHGLSVVMEGKASSKAVSYIEWLRQSKGQPTFRSMLEADLRAAIKDANSLGEFFTLMENMGYEIKYGNRLGFRLRGQEKFMVPGRKNPLFTEEGILAAIRENPDDIEAGLRRAVVYRQPYRPYRKYKKYTGFLALCVHYMYILGKIEKRQYPPGMTPQMRKAVMRFEQLREQFAFMRENDLTTPEALDAYQKKTEETLDDLIKQRTILNVQKRKRRKLYAALTDVSALADVKKLYEDGMTGMEAEYKKYAEAVSALKKSGVSEEFLAKEKTEIYEKLAQLNRKIRAERKKLAMCKDIRERTPQMERDIQAIKESSPEKPKKREINR